MATWVTHLMIADGVLEVLPRLDRRGFCVGNIAPDCNIENEDWTSFIPPREVTHFMRGKHKSFDDCEDFYRKIVAPRTSAGSEEFSFLLGYYSHLLTDAAFAAMIRDGERVKSAWRRVMADERLRPMAEGMPEKFDSIKKLIPRERLFHGVSRIEAEYLRKNPGSGYLTEILPLEEFPDYLDFLPHGCIARKAKLMRELPDDSELEFEFVALSREEFDRFVGAAIGLVTRKVRAASESFERECV